MKERKRNTMDNETKIKLIREAEGFLRQAKERIKLCDDKETDYSSFRWEAGYFQGKIDALREI
jgi:hypothetical protein